MRVQRILSLAGVCSRRKAEEFIEAGRVRVNGKKVSLGDRADWDNDVITVGKQEVPKREQFMYLMMYKPVKFLTTVTDMYERKTVMDLLPTDIPRMVPVGRLDRDAEGMLLFTNDGEYANRVMHPRYTVPKTYRAWLDKPLHKRDKELLERGVTLKDGPVKDIKIHYVTKNCVDITIHVGRNKIVKRIFNEANYRVVRLKRTAIGSLNLGNLKVGFCQKLSEKQATKVFEFDSKQKNLVKNNNVPKKNTKVSQKTTKTVRKAVKTKKITQKSTSVHKNRSAKKKAYGKPTSAPKRKSKSFTPPKPNRTTKQVSKKKTTAKKKVAITKGSIREKIKSRRK